MPVYRFNFLSASTLRRDPTGHEYGSDIAALKEAIAAAREIASQRVLSGEPLGRDAYEVRNEAGEVIHTITLKSVVNLG